MKIFRFRLDLIAAACLLVIACSAAVTKSDFETRLGIIRQQFATGQFRQAARAISQLRYGLADTGTYTPDFRAMATEIKSASAKGPLNPLVQDQLNLADSSFRVDNVAATVKALDTAELALGRLSRGLTTQAHLQNARAEVERQTSAKGSPSLDSLQDLAKYEYMSGLFAESISSAQRELESAANYSVGVSGPQHYGHTILGLNYFAQGKAAAAWNELQASLSFSTGPRGPSMALAKALLPEHKDQVIAYLDQCSRLVTWPERQKASDWKAALQNGRTPEFGSQAELP